MATVMAISLITLALEWALPWLMILTLLLVLIFHLLGLLGLVFVVLLTTGIVLVMYVDISMEGQ